MNTELTVVTEDWAPYNYYHEGRLTGLSTDIVRQTLAKAGIIAKFRMLPWPRAYDLALHQPNVLIYTILKTRAREPLFYWIGPISKSLTLNLYRLKSRIDITPTTLEETKKFRVGVMRDDISHEILMAQGFVEGQNLDLAHSYALSFKKLFKKRIDFIMGNDLGVAWQARALGHQFCEFQRTLHVMDAGYYMALSKGTPPALVQTIRRAFESLPANYIESLLQSYMDQTPPIQSVPF